MEEPRNEDVETEALAHEACAEHGPSKVIQLMPELPREAGPR